MLGVGDNLIGIQGHPEFEPDYSRALMESRRGHLIPEETVDAGLATLASEPDTDRLARWILDFVQIAAQEK
jgi:hypothetical protein